MKNFIIITCIFISFTRRGGHVVRPLFYSKGHVVRKQYLLFDY